ncbi:group II intron reverse transcriptase/maturase [Bythopirellula polymerisocia]|uniref:Group II intron-encoded protein LtrA n=1 Tax=Bythopirellula polymerisocia TaxID=2528003 RepID=A0A5C6CEA4_9BACT|nr:group II intron reverse transcriptase/maturase [Bythopirellula polymerisocia]TWU21761.1 Group II intron-encoded protein LtrA [Bythopirellula polymerisocia]
MPRNSIDVYTKQRRIAALARRSSEMAFTSLAYLMDIDWLKDAYRCTRKDGAAGVDGVTAEQYEQDLEGNLQSLLDRAKSGTYKAPPVRRVHIPKGGSTTETRPLGIPTLEDKILQRAVVMLLDPIYEQDFLDCSYGFRRGRSAHDALTSFRDQTMRHWRTGVTVLEVDIRKFFDNLDHQHLRQFLRQRVRDGVLLRLIDKWLKAGVMEDGNVSYPDSGSPQGGVVSPLISNVFLHYVLDLWFEQEVKPRLRGKAFLIRYADDFVIGFCDPRDAERVLEVLPKRFGRYGLTVHPTKTKLISFRPPSSRTKDDDRPGTFDLLGFTHYWAKSLKGYWVVKLKTATDRFTRAVRRIDQWCHDNRHLSLAEQQHKLNQKLRGHYAYYGVTGNSEAMNRFRQEVENRWRKWLNRRNNIHSMHWQKFCALLRRYPLAPARAVRSQLRHAAKP